MRTIPRTQLQAIIDKVRGPGSDRNEEEVNVAIFRLFDDRELRQQRRLIEQFVEDNLPPDPSGFYEGLRALEPRVYQRWAIVDPFIYVDNDYQSEAPLEEFHQLQGYHDADGNFVPTPSLSPLRQYCSIVEDALALKNCAFGPYLLLRWSEVPGEWGAEYEVVLSTETGDVVGAFRSDQVSLAIVGAVLDAMASGWTHNMARFQVVE
jgi:hypothetical protein